MLWREVWKVCGGRYGSVWREAWKYVACTGWPHVHAVMLTVACRDCRCVSW
jgi:hypothetical protein